MENLIKTIKELIDNRKDPFHYMMNDTNIINLLNKRSELHSRKIKALTKALEDINGQFDSDINEVENKIAMMLRLKVK